MSTAYKQQSFAPKYHEIRPLLFDRMRGCEYKGESILFAGANPHGVLTRCGSIHVRPNVHEMGLDARLPDHLYCHGIVPHLVDEHEFDRNTASVCQVLLSQLHKILLLSPGGEGRDKGC